MKPQQIFDLCSQKRIVR